MKFYIIGITDEVHSDFSPHVRQLLMDSKVFSGGRRHHDLVREYLPKGYIWIDIVAPLSGVYEEWRKEDMPIVVFASGDPLFFGIGGTIRRAFPEAEVRVEAAPNSLQMLAHSLLLPYEDMRMVSLTGRPWQELDCALMERAPKIGVLTDATHTPAAIAQRMAEYGYGNYCIHVGEHLGGKKERVTTLSLMDASKQVFERPCCCILEATEALSPRAFGIPDESLEPLPGRPGMMTKMPIRLLSLQRLELRHHQVLWDIGACTGSVSIEARLQFPHLRVVAFERREECEGIIQRNARSHGTPGIDLQIGDFLTTDLTTLPHPDAVFIGGHGGQLSDILLRVTRYAEHGTVIVMNAVSEESEMLFLESCEATGLQLDNVQRVEIDQYHPIKILKAYYE